MNTHLRNIYLRKRRLCPSMSLDTRGNMFRRRLSCFIVFYPISIFHSKCPVRFFDVMHQKIKPHLTAKADLVCMDLKQRKSLQDWSPLEFILVGMGLWSLPALWAHANNECLRSKEASVWHHGHRYSGSSQFTWKRLWKIEWKNTYF